MGNGSCPKEGPVVPGSRLVLRVGAVAGGGGCTARAPDNRVVFVRHALPGEQVVAAVTEVRSTYLRADAISILEASDDRVQPACPHAGPGRCGGCDFQHASLPAQRLLKAARIEEQLRRVARVDRAVVVERVEVPGLPDDGLGWRTRIRFAADRGGRLGFHRHRSHAIERISTCPIASAEVTAIGLCDRRWPGATCIEVAVPFDGGDPAIRVELSDGVGSRQIPVRPSSDPLSVPAVERGADRSSGVVTYEVEGHLFAVGPGVFWQAHRGAAACLTRAVLDGLAPEQGDRVADLYAGAGLFTVPLASAVGPSGSVVALERNPRACADAERNTAEFASVEVIRSTVDARSIGLYLGCSDLAVLDPPRRGAGPTVMAALASLRPPLRRLASVSCDPATFARDLRVLLDLGWSLRSLRAFDLFPMTEHVELVAVVEPASG
ncbi:MAG: class I SAM-dependent RNA methyltransferase [Acidimicrobiales bacterium]